MAAYSKDGGIVARFYERGTKKSRGAWGECVTVAKGFVATNGTESGWVSLANAEFAQLETGRIIYACNLRPENWRHDIHPCAIAIATSDDGGGTWSGLRTIYAPVPDMAADGEAHGCYEPFVLPLKGARAQIYFADETPYAREAKCAWQNISCIETADGGETWSKPKIAAYTPECRDGMPAVMDLGKWRYLAIEANPPGTKFHPQIVKCSRKDGSWERAARFEPFEEPPDWSAVYGGAPYIAATDNYILLSWQEEDGEESDTTLAARVAAAPKREVARDGAFATMRGASTPPGVEGKMYWNSLCPMARDSFLLVSEVKGRIIVYPGKIKEVKQ